MSIDTGVERVDSGHVNGTSIPWFRGCPTRLHRRWVAHRRGGSPPLGWLTADGPAGVARGWMFAAGCSQLLALADDGQRIIFELLCDALRPDVALQLSACCHELRTISHELRTELRRRHGAARRLCARVNTSFVALGETKELLWYGQGLTVAHLTTLGMLLSTNALPQLEILNLSVNRFGPEGMAVFEELSNDSLPRLLTLDLTGNALGSAGAAALASVLGRGALPRLEVLKLGRNDIGDQGLCALAPPLRRLQALKEVYLYSNKIGDEGVAALLANLGHAQLQQLRTLNLERNLINDAGCTSLIAALDRALPPFESLSIRQAACCLFDSCLCGAGPVFCPAVTSLSGAVPMSFEL